MSLDSNELSKNSEAAQPNTSVKNNQLKPSLPTWLTSLVPRLQWAKTPQSQLEVFANPNEAKDRLWTNKRAEIDRTVDGLGRGMDEGIKDSVVAYNLLGINTTASCEGHTDHGMPTPWIDIKPDGQPKIRFVEEMRILQEVANARGIALAEIQKPHDKQSYDAFWEAYGKLREQPETEEYLAWRKQAEQLEIKAQTLLDEFYAQRQTSDSTKFRLIHDTDEGKVRLMAGARNLEEIVQQHSHPLPESELIPLLAQRQKEMGDLTVFLREKFYGQ